MRGRHRLVGLLLGVLAASLLRVAGVAFAALPPGGTFTDDNGNVHEENTEAIAAEGITRGCNPPNNDRFCPDSTVTRGQMAAFLVRAFGYTNTGGGDLFVDDNGSIFEADIDRLGTAGVTKGCNPPTNGRYCPESPVLRDQMASFLARALDIDPIYPPPAASVGLDFVPRDEWGAVPAVISAMTTHTIRALTIHHLGDQLTIEGPPRYRSWQTNHVDRGWGDLAYHFIIGVDGTVYEARDTRYKGATGTSYDPNGHFLVVVEGNFEIDNPTESQLDSLVTLLAWAATEFDVSPSTITGHRDHAATACPGKNLYPYIASGQLEAEVGAAIRDG